MQDQHPNAANGSSVVARQLSSRLNDLLEGGSATEAINTLQMDHALLAESRSRLPELKSSLEPCTPHDVAKAIFPLFAIYGQPVAFETDDHATQEMFWELWADALEGMPALAVKRAARIHLRTSKFFPKPSEIREQAEIVRGQMRVPVMRILLANNLPLPADWAG